MVKTQLIFIFRPSVPPGRNIRAGQYFNFPQQIVRFPETYLPLYIILQLLEYFNHRNILFSRQNF